MASLSESIIMRIRIEILYIEWEAKQQANKTRRKMILKLKYLICYQYLYK